MFEAGTRVPPAVAAQRIRASVDPVRALARTMGVRVVQVPTADWGAFPKAGLNKLLDAWRNDYSD